jgi:tellurite resistance protein
VLHRAWNDGQITADERGMLDDISLHLGLEPDIVDKIESEVSSERVESTEQQTVTYLEVLEVAWQDGFISDDEQAMLDSLARSLGLDSEYMAKVQLEWIILHS